MTRKKWQRGRPPPRRWQPLEKGERIPPSPEKIAAFRAEAGRYNMSPDEAEAMILEEGEIWMNDLYVVHVTRGDSGDVAHLGVRRTDRGVEFPWRDLQRIKTQLAGAETEAVELFPAESRLVDTANHRWLWCLPPGERLPVGFNDGRHITGPEDAKRIGAGQANLEKDWHA